MHGNGRRRRVSDYGLQLREKQKAKATYGVLEKQFRRYYDAASRQANTGFGLLMKLEQRLDNVVYRAGLAQSRAQARQLITHGHFGVNGKKVSIPSYSVRVDDFVKSIDAHEDSRVENASLPNWLTEKDGGVLVSAITTREQIETALNEQLIVEYYSR
jgi:small subunit ribosomal protein S4